MVMLSDINFERFGARQFAFKFLKEHLLRSEGYIIETGSAWHKDNWEGQGQSTLFWDALARENQDLRVISIDKNPFAIATAKEQTELVRYLEGDSVMVLSRIGNTILRRTKLLYLDSFDWHETRNIESAHHHLSELAAVFARLPEGCLIAVDDCHAPFQGKHWMVEQFLAKMNILPAVSSYVTVWIKPFLFDTFT